VLATKTTVRIMGREYNIKGEESAEYIHRVALFVNDKMTEIKKANTLLDAGDIGTLACINIADEYLKVKDEAEALKKDLEKYKKAMAMRR